MELKDTISMMTSSDYKERFRAEYFQLKIRYDRKFAAQAPCFSYGVSGAVEGFH